MTGAISTTMRTARPRRLPIAVLGIVSSVTVTAASASAIDSIEAPLVPQSYEPLVADVREAIETVVILPADAARGESVTGTYDKTEPGLIEGADAGRHTGTMSTGVGPVTVNVPIPILQIPGAIFGGLSGAARKELQEFRDALTEEIMNADDQPLANSSLALDVHRNVRGHAPQHAKLLASLSGVPDATDAILYVGFDEFKMDVDGKKATLILTASATLKRKSDGETLYIRTVEYQDTDTLENWTRDDLALWHDFANFASHYLARQLAGEAFYREVMPVTLRPEASASAKVHRKLPNRYVSDSPVPELAWSLDVKAAAEGSEAAAFDPATLSYDIEIYDANRLVYAGTQPAGQRHVLSYELEPCRTYRWSVRPSATVEQHPVFGDWLRLGDEGGEAFIGRNGLIGRQASVAPAYTQDFPELEIRCGRRR